MQSILSINKIAAKWFTKLLFQDNNFNTYICAINRIQKWILRVYKKRLLINY